MVCVQQQLDSNLCLPKLKRDYAIATGFSKKQLWSGSERDQISL